MLTVNQITYFSKQTVALAQQQVDIGGLPFSSIIVDQNGERIGEGTNQVNALHDCTAHAEIQAIRTASKSLGKHSLEGSTLFASGEPCGLCYMAIRFAKISQVVVLLDRTEVMQLGFDYLWTYQPQDNITASAKIANLSVEYKNAPFIQYKQNLDGFDL